MRSSRYMDRAMKSRDPRFARVLGKLGYESKQKQAIAQAPTVNLDGLRADAQRLGVKIDGRWGEDRLRQEIAAARESSARPAAPTAAPVEQEQESKPVGAMTTATYGRRDMRATED